jgi:hypothetical protein
MVALGCGGDGSGGAVARVRDGCKGGKRKGEGS